MWPNGKALDYESRDSRFDPWHGQLHFLVFGGLFSPLFEHFRHIFQNRLPASHPAASIYQMLEFSTAHLALPGVATLISFLSYGSQILFRNIGPYPLSRLETVAFNALICSIWICYFQACFVDPGAVPSEWKPQAFPKSCAEGASQSDGTPHPKQRWCRKCKAIKPPRAHHCRSCGRYAIESPSLILFSDLTT